MINPFSASRLSRIFSNPAPQTVPRKRFLTGISPMQTETQGIDPSALGGEWEKPEMGAETSEGSKFFDELMRLRGNRGPALTAYQEALKGIPQTGDYKPSKWRRAGAAAIGALSGFGGGAEAGVGAANKFIRAPYDTAMEDYQNKMTGLGESAKLEQDETEAQLRALSSARAMGLKYDEYRLKQLESDRDYDIKNRTARVAEGNLGVARSRAQAYAEKMGRPDYDYKDLEDGSVMAVNKNDPSDRSIIPAKTVSAATMQTGRMQAETARRGQEDTAGYRQRQTDIQGFQAETQRANQLGQESYRRTRLEQLWKSLQATPSELSRAMSNALDILAQNPVFLQFIETDPRTKARYPKDFSGGNFWTSGPSRDEYDAFRKALRDEIKRQTDRGGIISDDSLDGTDDDFEIGQPEF